MAAAAPSQVDTQTNQNALSQIKSTLESYGFTGTALTQLSTWAWNEITSGNSTDQITLDLEQTPEFKQRFPAIGVLAQQGVAISPSDYIGLEQQYASLMQQAGLSSTYGLSPLPGQKDNLFDELIANQVSPSELTARINQGYLAVSQAPSSVVQQFQDYYNVQPAQLAAYFLNPKEVEPKLLNQAVAAQIGSAAKLSGFEGTGINQAQAYGLAQQGVTYSQAQTGFQNLATQKELTQGELPGQKNSYQFTAQNLEQSQFGSDAQTKQQLAIQADMEKNYFQQGSQIGSTSTGLTGAGTVQR